MIRHAWHGWAALFLTALSCSLAGCKLQAGGAASHFEAMAAIAERHGDDCNSMGTELQSYLADHGTGLEAAVRKTSGGGESEQLARAAERLDHAVAPCRFDPNVEEFARTIAPLVREATGGR